MAAPLALALVVAASAGALAIALAPRAARRIGGPVTALAALGAVLAWPTPVRALPILLAVATGALWLQDRGIPGNRARPWPVRLLAALLATCAAATAWAALAG